MIREDVAMGVMSELEHVVRAGWVVRREEVRISSRSGDGLSFEVRVRGG